MNTHWLKAVTVEEENDGLYYVQIHTGCKFKPGLFEGRVSWMIEEPVTSNPDQVTCEECNAAIKNA